MTHLSLFSGIGGLDIAAQWAGFRTVGLCEYADYPYRVLQKRFPDVPIWRDIRTLTGDDFRDKAGVKKPTVVSGGFPCQPHILAGIRLASHDERDLWSELLRVFCETGAEWLVAENVRGLLSSENGRFFGRILGDLANIGCDVWWYCFPAHAAGAPFWGERVAVVASSNRVGRERSIERVPPLPEWRGRIAEIRTSQSRYWEYNISEPCICRKDDGFARGVDRLRCLGNAVVPAQFYPIFAAIAEMMKNATN